jgi:hypothetical protein
MSRSGLYIVGAVALALTAAGVLFFSNFQGIQQLVGFPPTTEQLMAQISDASATGGQAVTFSDSNTKAWSLAEGHRLERFSLNGGDVAFARLTSLTRLDSQSFAWPTLGLSWLLTREFNNATRGREIEIGVIARRASVNSSDQLFVMYATQQAGNTGWKPIRLSNDFELHKVTFKVPQPDGGFQNPSILVLHADAAGKGRSVELLGAFVRFAKPN